MHDLPTELWLKIMPSACLDDGSTARALSAVWHRIRAISHEFRYQSIAVTGSRQVQHLVDALQHPDNLGCRVEALFVEADDISLITQLCSIVAPTVEILTIVATAPSPNLFNPPRTSPIDFDFPRLRELTLRGSVMLPRSNTFAPVLERVEISYDTACTNITFWGRTHPNLICILLHFDRNIPVPRILVVLFCILIARIVALEFVPIVARDIQEERDLHRAKVMLEQRAKRQSQFVLLPEVMKGGGIARKRWLDSVQGKGGVWALIEATVRDKIRQARDEGRSLHT
ncbi:hypothetical protein BDW22DRAFT_1354375 [Trametopsis cervina]|nr:hypothetical protein BDW22DRAFT_1354375 [Trametopsis cervina]